MTLAALGVGAATLWRPIQHRWLTWLVLGAEAPVQSLVENLAAREVNSASLLNRLWATEKIPHRLAVLDYLQSHRASGNALLADEVAILKDAPRSGDLALLHSPSRADGYVLRHHEHRQDHRQPTRRPKRLPLLPTPVLTRGPPRPRQLAR